MIKQLLYIVIGLLVAFIAIKAVWRYWVKKRRDSAKQVRQSPRYIELENEKEIIRRKRNELEAEHPYRKLLVLKINLQNAERDSNQSAVSELIKQIDTIFAEWNNASEDTLAEAYDAQISAMSLRLDKIEFEQRAMLIKAEKVL